MKKTILFVLLMGMVFASCKKENTNPTPQVQSSCHIKTIPIGTWNMETTSNISVEHGVADFKKITSIDVVIYSDFPTAYPLSIGGAYQLTQTNIDLQRFDDSDFNNNQYFTNETINRGIITIHYEI